MTYKVITICLAFLLVITVGGLLAWQQLLSSSVRAFSWKALPGHGIPRITDFGISKLLGSQQVHATVTNVRGTRGYIAPEWLRSVARVDTKADVYSFGVVLLEMICCRRCQDQVVPDSDLPPEGVGGDDDETVTLFGWAAHQLVETRRTELMLRRHADADADAVEDMERLDRFALWCIEPNRTLRPTMRQVVHVLETSQVRVEVPPNPPGCDVESSKPLIPHPDVESSKPLIPHPKD